MSKNYLESRGDTDDSDTHEESETSEEEDDDVTHTISPREQFAAGVPGANIAAIRRDLASARDTATGIGLQSTEGELGPGLQPNSESSIEQKSSSIETKAAHAHTTQNPPQKPQKIPRHLKTKHRKINREHPEFELTYDMMLGIRTTVSRAESQPLRHDLPPQAFTHTVHLRFPGGGSATTPAHQARDFKFKDYMPEVFRNIRARFDIDPAEYLLCICGNFSFLEFISNSKSGQFFFYSHDRRYMIKTISQEESKFLRKILPEYYNHIMTYPNTLLARFFGMHRVKPHKKKEHHFLIMGSVFSTRKTIDRVYDLKGSLHGRSVTPQERLRPGCVFKDKDFIDDQAKILLGPELSQTFLQQLEADVALLTRLSIMDYSLLLGVHNGSLYRRSMRLSGTFSSVPGTFLPRHSTTPTDLASVPEVPADGDELASSAAEHPKLKSVVTEEPQPLAIDSQQSPPTVEQVTEQKGPTDLVTVDHVEVVLSDPLPLEPISEASSIHECETISQTFESESNSADPTTPKRESRANQLDPQLSANKPRPLCLSDAGGSSAGLPTTQQRILELDTPNDGPLTTANAERHVQASNSTRVQPVTARPSKYNIVSTPHAYNVQFQPSPTVAELIHTLGPQSHTPAAMTTPVSNTAVPSLPSAVSQAGETSENPSLHFTVVTSTGIIAEGESGGDPVIPLHSPAVVVSPSEVVQVACPPAKGENIQTSIPGGGVQEAVVESAHHASSASEMREHIPDDETRQLATGQTPSANQQNVQSAITLKSRSGKVEVTVRSDSNADQLLSFLSLQRPVDSESQLSTPTPAATIQNEVEMGTMGGSSSELVENPSNLSSVSSGSINHTATTEMKQSSEGVETKMSTTSQTTTMAATTTAITTAGATPIPTAPPAIEVAHSIFTQFDGGIQARDRYGQPTGQTLYFGVIDILTFYGIKKRIESGWKSLWTKDEVSAVPPKKYGKRFLEFMQKATTVPPE